MMPQINTAKSGKKCLLVTKVKPKWQKIGKNDSIKGGKNKKSSR